MIIDIHTHAFPTALAPRAMEVLANNSNTIPFLDGTCDALQASMNQSQVDISAIMPIATKPSQARQINKWAADICAQGDGLVSFGSLHPDQDDWQDEINALTADGVKGVKFHPDYQLFYVDDPKMTPMYKALAEAGLIVLFHAGIDIGLPPPVHCPPDRLAKVLDQVPDLTIIAAHMGGYKQWDDVERFLVGRDIYLDTSYSLGDMGVQKMTSMIKSHGADRVLFGTDSPWTDQFAEVASIRALDLSAKEIDALLGANAARLLSIDNLP